MTSPLAGKRAPAALLVNVAKLVAAYYTERPDPGIREQRVSFGTSGHRGSSLQGGFNEAHILAVTQAICAHRGRQGIDGPLFLGKDTHALSEPAFLTALEVLAANGVEVMVDGKGGYTPTPVISHAILSHNRGRKTGWADGIVITPSHNPPEDGGFKYNPPHGGPADADVTSRIEEQANALLAGGLRGVKRISAGKARSAGTTHSFDYVESYVGDLGTVVDLDTVRGSGLRLGVDPMGGAGTAYWGPIADRYGIRVEVVNEEVDATFRFMPLDWDGKIRMDCSSRYAMANLILLKDRFDVAFGNDTDNDRHGIVVRNGGLMNPNHFLSACVSYLFAVREKWPKQAAVGKTVVTSRMVDRVAEGLGRPLLEVPVGFKHFVEGLRDAEVGFAGEESAGASFLRRDGTVWTTDKDGIIMDLLAAEMTARTGRDPGERYMDLARRFGEPAYERIDSPATPEQKAKLGKLTAAQVEATELAGERIVEIVTNAPGNGRPVGGVKVVTENGWFAARPSGTEDVYKIYAESFLGRDHLRRIQEEARALVGKVLGEG